MAAETSEVKIYRNDIKETYAGKIAADLSHEQARKVRDQLNAFFSEHGMKLFAARNAVED